MAVLIDTAIVLALGLAGALLWSTRVRPRLVGLQPLDTLPSLLAIGLFGVVIDTGVQAILVQSGEPLDLETATLREIMLVQSFGNAAAALSMILAAHLGLPDGLRALGLRRQGGPSPLVAALAAWLLFVPLLIVVRLVNSAALELLGQPESAQRNLELFLAEDGASSATVWLAMVVVIPVCEELLMRGALYGGLRRMVSPATAMVVSATIFALLHEPVAWLPVGLLGVLLAWLYERTGSLTVPCLVHGLQNGITLVLALVTEPST